MPDLKAAPEDELSDALARAANWMADFPQAELRFDAAIGMHHIAVLLPQASFHQARQNAISQAKRDNDNPMQRIWNEKYIAPPKHTRAWKAPLAGQKRINVNRPVIEALHCDRNGIREESLAYITGPMRDQGRYHSAHALWALVIAHERSCLSDDRFEQLSKPLRDELRKAQPSQPVFKTTMDVDLYAERTLMLLLAKDTQGTQKYIEHLLQLQNENGSWGMAKQDEPAYYSYHATLVTCWALAVWKRHNTGKANRKEDGQR